MRIPLPLAPLAAFHKIAKRRFDDISSVAVAFALDVRDGVVARAAIGLGGVAATPLRATATEAALVGRPWTADTAREAAAVLRGEGTPIDDHRASAAYRAAMLGTACSSSTPRPARGGAGMTELRTRPERPVVGAAIPHESADLHVTGLALYTDDLVNRHPGVLHAYPVQAPHTHARVTSLRTEPALRCPAWSACSPPPTCPG